MKSKKIWISLALLAIFACKKQEVKNDCATPNSTSNVSQAKLNLTGPLTPAEARVALENSLNEDYAEEDLGYSTYYKVYLDDVPVDTTNYSENVIISQALESSNGRLVAKIDDEISASVHVKNVEVGLTYTGGNTAQFAVTVTYMIIP